MNLSDLFKKTIGYCGGSQCGLKEESLMRSRPAPQKILDMEEVPSPPFKHSGAGRYPHKPTQGLSTLNEGGSTHSYMSRQCAIHLVSAGNGAY